MQEGGNKWKYSKYSSPFLMEGGNKLKYSNYSSLWLLTKHFTQAQLKQLAHGNFKV